MSLGLPAMPAGWTITFDKPLTNKQVTANRKGQPVPGRVSGWERHFKSPGITELALTVSVYRNQASATRAFALPVDARLGSFHRTGRTAIGRRLGDAAYMYRYDADDGMVLYRLLLRRGRVLSQIYLVGLIVTPADAIELASKQDARITRYVTP
jgi:hypothetical protein